jgi:hypothetical protein
MNAHMVTLGQFHACLYLTYIEAQGALTTRNYLVADESRKLNTRLTAEPGRVQACKSETKRSETMCCVIRFKDCLWQKFRGGHPCLWDYLHVKSTPSGKDLRIPVANDSRDGALLTCRPPMIE